MKRTSALTLWCITTMLLRPLSAPAFETWTHGLINERAASQLVMSGTGLTFDDFLRFSLLFPDGLDTALNGQTISRWLNTGGVAEDQYLPEILGQKLAEIAGGVTRSPRHFHTPLKTWDQSGLNLGGIQFESSPRWAQLPDQGFTGKAAWGDARSTYYQALTASDPGQRATLFASTFKILGQLMHLVADLGSVAHTRNAQHILGDPFEEFVGNPLNEPLINGFLGMDPAQVRLFPTNDAVATVPVARLWDTDKYNGSNPDITTQTTPNGATVGLAEFTSANFFSRNTISKITGADPVLPHPAIDQLVPGPIANQRQYWSRNGPGIPITHMAVEGAFNLFVPSTWWRFSLDDQVFQDYATALLPRAIGYSAGLIDYFFRGRINISSLLPEERPPSNPSTTMTLQYLFNTTPDEDTGNGTLQLVLLYRGQHNTTDSFSNTVSSQTSGSISNSPQDATFSFSSLPFPATMGADCSPHPSESSWGLILCASYANYDALLVYRGPLGAETDSVIVSTCHVTFERTQFEWGLQLSMYSGELC